MDYIAFFLALIIVFVIFWYLTTPADKTRETFELAPWQRKAKKVKKPKKGSKGNKDKENKGSGGSGGSSDGGGAWKSGRATWYCVPERGDNVCGQGSFGWVAPDVCTAAVSTDYGNSLGNRTLEIETSSGRRFQTRVHDLCPSSECDMNHLDLTGACWKQNGLNLDEGNIGIKWRVL